MLEFSTVYVFWVAASEVGNSLLQGMTGVDDDHTQDRCASLGS